MKKYLLILSLILVFIYTIFFSPIFKINSVDLNSPCSGQNEQPIFKGKNILMLNLDDVKQTLITGNQCAESVEVKKVYPQKLEITFKVKQPVAKIDGTELQISEDGFITNNIDTKNLPVINIPSEIKISQGDKINDPIVLFALAVLKSLQKSDFNAQSVRILTFGDVAVYNNESAAAIFNKEKDIDTQVGSLQSILAKAKIDATKIAKIDLRFDKPVITTK